MIFTWYVPSSVVRDRTVASSCVGNNFNHLRVAVRYFLAARTLASCNSVQHVCYDRSEIRFAAGPNFVPSLSLSNKSQANCPATLSSSHSLFPGRHPDSWSAHYSLNQKCCWADTQFPANSGPLPSRSNCDRWKRFILKQNSVENREHWATMNEKVTHMNDAQVLSFSY